MRYLLFSDIHSNLEALESVLDHAGQHKVDAKFCLGDFVGYGANPDECVQTAAGVGDISAVLGNHDAATIDPEQMMEFNAVAREGVAYSDQALSDKSRKYLQGLDYTIEPDDDFVVVHASPNQPEKWIYILGPAEAAHAFEVLQQSVAFVGHSHFPVIFLDNNNGLRFMPGAPVVLPDNSRAIVNVGSVGQPRDGDPRAAYVIFDSDVRSVEIFRVEYDIEKAGGKIIKAGLPPILAQRLHHGQ